MDRLPIAVKCHDCNNQTRNPSGYCQHHGRNSKIANQVASASGALTNVRLAEVQRLKQVSPEKIEEVAMLGQYLVKLRPTVMVDTEHHTATIKNAFSSDDQEEPFTWNGQTHRIAPNQQIQIGDVIFYRSEDDLLAYPDAKLPHSARVEMNKTVTQDAFQTAEDVRHLRAETYSLASKSESYDDKAEVLAQLRLAGNDAGAIRYSTPSEGKVIVFVRSPSNADVIERWTLERRAETPGDDTPYQEYAYRYKVSGEGELISRRTREKIADYIGGNARHERADLIASVCDAIETIDKHAVTKDGRVHLPLGWTD